MNGFERWVQDVAGGLRRASSISSAGHSRSSAWKKNLDLLTSAVDADERQQLHFWEMAETDIPTFAYFLKDPGALEAMIRRIVAANGQVTIRDENKSRLARLTRSTISIRRLRSLIDKACTLEIGYRFINQNRRIEFDHLTALGVRIWRQDPERPTVFETQGLATLQNKVDFDQVEITDIEIAGQKFPAINEIKDLHLACKQQVDPEFDIVFTWVDGSDPDWQARKEAALNSGKSVSHPAATGRARYASHDELRFALRSICKFMDNYHRIYIVTDRQRPSWLVENDRLRIVDHSEIFPDPTCLPVFNSHAIEACLHRIKGLKDQFIYFNDDVILGKSTDVEIFFPKRGHIGYFPSERTFVPFGKINNRTEPVDSAAMNARDLLKTDSFIPSQKMWHVPLAVVRPEAEKLEARFQDLYDQTRRHKFRDPADIAASGSFFIFHMMAAERAEQGTIEYNYVDLSKIRTTRQLSNAIRHKESKRPNVICLNDGHAVNETRDEMYRLMDENMRLLFPEPCEFETAE